MFGIKQLLKHNGAGCPTISIVGDGRLGGCDGARGVCGEEKVKGPAQAKLGRATRRQCN